MQNFQLIFYWSR